MPLIPEQEWKFVLVCNELVIRRGLSGLVHRITTRTVISAVQTQLILQIVLDLKNAIEHVGNLKWTYMIHCKMYVL